MQYDYVPKKIDGQWHNCLRITADEPVDFAGQKDFTVPIEGAEIHYHTNGLVKETQDSAHYYYWFSLLSPPSTTIEGESSELHTLRLELEEADEALDIAIGDEANEQD